MKVAEVQDPEDTEPEVHKIDAWMIRYSRWRRKRLVRMAELPLSALTLRTLFLSGCILLDGVFVPWIATVLQGGFSYVLFAALLLPTLAVEGILYHRMTSPGGTKT